MHSRKRDDRPQIDCNSNTAQISCPHCGKIVYLPKRSQFSRCPECGGPKSDNARKCAKCRKKSLQKPGCRRKGSNWVNDCPQCGKEKHWKSKLCRRCGVISRRVPVTNDIIFVLGQPCRLISLTQGQTAIVDQSLYTLISKFTWQAHYSKVTRSYYAIGWVNGRVVSMSRFILGLDESDPRLADHINRNTLDNRSSNLRPSTNAENARNRSMRKDNKTGFRGVVTRVSNGRTIYIAQIAHKGKCAKLGKFHLPEEAARAYDCKALELFGEFASLNFPQ